MTSDIYFANSKWTPHLDPNSLTLLVIPGETACKDLTLFLDMTSSNRANAPFLIIFEIMLHFKHMIFQRCQKALLWSEGLNKFGKM